MHIPAKPLEVKRMSFLGKIFEMPAAGCNDIKLHGDKFITEGNFYFKFFEFDSTVEAYCEFDEDSGRMLIAH